MKKIIFTCVVSAFFTGSVWGQVKILDEAFSPTGVSNEGVVAGYYDQASPYYLWNPATSEMKEIGGVSAGFGIGGKAQFSANGKYLSGTMYNEIEISTDWKRTQIVERDFTFTGMDYTTKNGAFAVGKDPNDATKGVLLKTNDAGITWNDALFNIKGGLEAICFLTPDVGLIGGQNGFFGYTTSRGAEWMTMTPRPEGNNDEVVAYRTIDFMKEEPYAGAVGAELADGKFAVYHSPDGAETWQVATGVVGIPLDITHVDGTFFLGTKDGTIQKSTDGGLTWTKVFKTGGFLQPVQPVYKIRFADSKVGIVATDYAIYRTIDGGTNWKALPVGDAVSQSVKWRDLLWMDTQNVILVGTKGQVYSSSNAGETWSKIDMATDENMELTTIVKSEVAVSICGSNGNFFRKSLVDKATVAEMGRYDVEAGVWTPLGSFGVIKDGVSVSSGYAISGDGKTVVGLAEYYNTDVTINNSSYAHAVAWTEGKGMTDLGSLYSGINRSTRADAVNYDGSVIVGWQDQNGPWYSAVWRKNGEAGYKPNEYLLIDPEADPKSSLNHAPHCFAVSQNGEWIGGRGYPVITQPLSIIEDDLLVSNQPWLWSQETGLKRLGIIKELEDNDGAVGYVSGINNDGTTAVGWFISGNFMWPFIWTAEGGMQNLNEYIAQQWDYDMENHQFCSILSMSPNGRYITGWGLFNDQYLFAGTVDLEAPSNIENLTFENLEARVYPNPATDMLHVDMNAVNGAQVRLLDMQGRVVLNQNVVASSNTLSLEGVSKGFYLLEVASEGMHKTYKIEVTN